MGQTGMEATSDGGEDPMGCSANDDGAFNHVGIFKTLTRNMGICPHSNYPGNEVLFSNDSVTTA